MGIALKVIIYLMTASVSLMSVTGNKGGPINITCVNTPETETAYQGGSITINCKYPRTEESIRYFCRKDENLHCTNLIMASKANYTKRDRFSLTDNKQQGVYTVTISTLTLDDSGTYQCNMHSPDNKSTECLTNIKLSVLNWDAITPIVKTCETRHTVKFDCHYQDIYESNEKFLCKGENPFNCKELIHTTKQDRRVDIGRFGITDNRRLKYFYVSIKNVSTADSGTYWCGFDRTWQHGEYIKILLTVAERRIKTKTSDSLPPPPSVQDDAPPEDDIPSNIGVIGGVVGSLALLMILVVVLLLVRHKLSRIQVCCAAGETSVQRTNAGHNTEHRDHNYEEIQMQNQQASAGDALPTIYATINAPADQLYYASINIQKDSASVSTDALPVTNKNGSSCDYSTVLCPLAAEKTLYSTVTKPGEL